MALPRKLYHGFNGYEVPIVPHASRSSRGKVPIKKTHEDNQVLKELSHDDKIFNFDTNTISKKFDQLEKICFADKFPTVSSTNSSGSYSGDFPCLRKFIGGHVIS
ncbi:hypothetical protein WN943_003990 [Citrus x changshan-huyou]